MIENRFRSSQAFVFKAHPLAVVLVTMMLKLLTASLKIGLSIRCSKSLASLIIMATYEYETLTRVTHNIRMYSSVMTVMEFNSALQIFTASLQLLAVLYVLL